METVPPQQGIMQRIPGAPDSSLKPFVKQVALQQVLLRRADSAHVTLKDEDKANMYTQIGQLVGNLESTLGVDPKMLADSAKSVPEKERLAAARVDAYLDRMMAGQAQPITIPLPLKKLLDAKYESSVNSAGIDRGLERATEAPQVGGLDAHGESAEVSDSAPGWRRRAACGTAAAGCTTAARAGAEQTARPRATKKP